MGIYDSVMVPCPTCGHKVEAQSKGAVAPYMETYDISMCPLEVFSDINRHAPWRCPECKDVFIVEFDLDHLIVPASAYSVKSLGKDAKAKYDRED